MEQRLDGAFSDLFEREVSVLWVTTGTAANCLALAGLVPPYGGVLCHREAHIQVDEAGAPEFFTGGAKLLLVDGPGAKLTVDALEDAREPDPRRRPSGPGERAVDHQRDRIWADLFGGRRRRRWATWAKRHGLGFHLDGARFGNAVASTGASVADLTWRAGVDALSFGFVKNGGLSAEALVLFDPALADGIKRRRKRSGHLLSKGRYLAAQLLAMVEGDLLARQCPRGQCGGAAAGRGGGRAAGVSGRGQ